MFAHSNSLTAKFTNDERIEFLKLSMEQVRDMNRGDEPVWKRKLAQHKIPAQHAAATEAAAAGQVTESSQQPIQASSSVGLLNLIYV